jgi:hypothetical protein
MGVFQIVALEPSPKCRGQGEVIKKLQFEMHPADNKKKKTCNSVKL